jgi:hypothetical protein
MYRAPLAAMNCIRGPYRHQGRRAREAAAAEGRPARRRSRPAAVGIYWARESGYNHQRESRPQAPGVAILRTLIATIVHHE